MSTSAGRFLIKFRLFVLGTALLTKMLMVLWSHGTCSRAANIRAVVRPLLLCGKTLSGFRTPRSFLPLPHQVQAVRAGDGFADEDSDGPSEPWHMFARR